MTIYEKQSKYMKTHEKIDKFAKYMKYMTPGRLGHCYVACASLKELVAHV